MCRSIVKTTRRAAALAAAVLLLAACTNQPTNQGTTPLPTLLPTAPPTAAPPLPSTGLGATGDVPSEGWQAGDAGLELRRISASVPSTQSQAPLLVLRLDLRQVRLRVGYSPGQPQSLREWRDERDALAALNGGFFAPDYSALGLTVSDGTAQGSSRDFGGMFAIDAAGNPSIRDLGQQPYDGSEQLAEALQSFPLLLRSGGAPARIEDNGERARRTAVAIDSAGRVLMIVAPTSVWTLQDFADALAASDLHIDSALNLDGGSSTGLIVRSGALDEQLLPFTPLPQVLLVERRSS